MRKPIIIPTVVMGFFLISPVAFAATTLDSGHTGTGMTLSGGSLTVTHSGASAWASSRSTTSKATGKWYYEITWGTTTGNLMMGGVVNSTAGMNDYVGTDTNGKSFYCTGEFRYNGSGSGSYATCTINDVLGVAVDVDSGNVSYYKNGTFLGTQTSAVISPYFAAVSIFTLNNAATINFGVNGFTYTIPTGYCNWDNGCVAAAGTVATTTSANQIGSDHTFGLAIIIFMLAMCFWDYYIVSPFFGGRSLIRTSL